jgi:hypothetical protein
VLDLQRKEEAMAPQRMIGLRLIEGHQVNVSLRDGTRLDDCQLVSRGRDRAPNLWLFTNGHDVFVDHDDIVDVWETSAHRSAA